MSFNSFMPLLALLGVLVLIPVALWLLRRAGVGGPVGANILQTVASLPVSPSQRVVVVSLQHGQNQHWLVLGVGQEAISTIATLDAPTGQMAAPIHPDAPTVAQLMARWRQGGGAQHGQ